MEFDVPLKIENEIDLTKEKIAGIEVKLAELESKHGKEKE